MLLISRALASRSATLAAVCCELSARSERLPAMRSMERWLRCCRRLRLLVGARSVRWRRGPMLCRCGNAKRRSRRCASTIVVGNAASTVKPSGRRASLRRGPVAQRARRTTCVAAIVKPQPTNASTTMSVMPTCAPMPVSPTVAASCSSAGQRCLVQRESGRAHANLLPIRRAKP